MIVTRLRAPPGHGGAGRFQILLGSLIRRGGVPSGAAAFIIYRFGELSVPDYL